MSAPAAVELVMELVMVMVVVVERREVEGEAAPVTGRTVRWGTTSA